MRFLKALPILNGLLRLAITLGTAATLLACGRKIQPQDSCNFVMNSQLQRVTWGPAGEAKLFVHSSVPPRYYQAIENAVETWNHQLGKSFLKIEGWGITDHDVPDKDGYSMIYWMTSWDKDKPTEQARTTIYWTGSVIYEADMRINADPSDFTYYDGKGPQDPRSVDLQSLVLHELGHVLGLAHVTDQPSVMQPTLAVNTLRLNPTNEDVKDLACGY